MALGGDNVNMLNGNGKIFGYALQNAGTFDGSKSDCPELLQTFLRSLYDIGRTSKLSEACMDKLMQRCYLLTARCLVDNFLANIPDISQPDTLLKLVIFLGENFSLSWRLAKCWNVRRIKKWTQKANTILQRVTVVGCWFRRCRSYGPLHFFQAGSWADLFVWIAARPKDYLGCNLTNMMLVHSHRFCANLTVGNIVGPGIFRISCPMLRRHMLP